MIRITNRTSRLERREIEALSQTSQTSSPIELFSERRFRLFVRYLRSYFSRNFSSVLILNRPDTASFAHRPVVVFCNHSSWWDAIMMHLLTSAVFSGRKPFAPMDEKALQHYRFFRKLGMFGVDQDTARGAARFLQVSREILMHTDTSLWLTPQGAFHDPRRRPLEFKPGLAHLARDQQAVFLPLAIEYPFWQERKPEALVSFGEPVDTAGMEQRSVKKWNDLLEARLEAAMDDLAQASIQRDAAAFDVLVDGSAGVNLLFDIWQRIKAALGGRRYSDRHSDIGSQ